MSHFSALAFDGALTAHRVGQVIISVQRINAAAFRTVVAHGATGAEVPELAQSFPTEAEARRAARDAYRAFADGASVAQVLARLVNGSGRGAPSPVAASPSPALVLVPRSELPRPAGATSLRLSEPQYRLLQAALNGGTAEIQRGDGEASISSLRVMARAGLVDLVTEPWGEPVGARVTGWGWVAVAHETARRVGKVPPRMVPVPAAALATFAARPLLHSPA